MPAFDDHSVSLEHFSGKARLFPLPSLVLFPHVMQPLHVFESRYRDLLEDALRDDHLIAMATLIPGWEKDYEGRPPLYPMGCLGQIITHYCLADGTYNVLLLGLQRIKLVEELKPAHLFREGRVELCDDRYPPCPLAHHKSLQQKLHNALLRVLPMFPEVHEQLDQLLDQDIPLGILTDVIGYMLHIELSRKQALLAEVDVYRRTELLLECLSETAVELVVGQSSVCFPPEFSTN